MVSAINPIIVEKIDQSDYSSTIKNLLKLILEFESLKEFRSNQRYTKFYDDQISNYLKPKG